MAQEQSQDQSQEQAPPRGPDLTEGVAFADFVDGKLVGHVGGDEVLLIRSGAEVFAIGAHCTHYHGPLADGLVVGDSVRCPWHHACFDLRTGEALRAPALSPVACWQVVERDGRIFVTETREQPKPRGKSAAAQVPARIVIVGGGAAGFAAAEMLRRRDYRGSIVMLSADSAPPVDRPNLSKDYLAGSAPEDWLPLRPDEFYADNGIELRLGCDVVGIDCAQRELRVAGSASIAYDRLLLATGAEPVRLSVPGADQAHVHTLRSLADCRAIIEAAKGARRALVIGASFIGLEAAASLRARDIEVHVAAPEPRPMERVLGPQSRRLHPQACTNSTASSSISAKRSPRSTAAARRLKAAPRLRPTSSSSVSACGRAWRWPSRPASRSTAAWSSMLFCRRARPASMPPATSPAGPTRIPANASASSIGLSPNVKARPRRPTCSA